MRHSGVGEMNTNAEEGPADAEHVAQDATSNNVEDRERRGILIAPLCRTKLYRKLCRDALPGLLGSFLSSRAGINDKTCSRLVRAILSKSVKLPKLGVAR